MCLMELFFLFISNICTFLDSMMYWGYLFYLVNLLIILLALMLNQLVFRYSRTNE